MMMVEKHDIDEVKGDLGKVKPHHAKRKQSNMNKRKKQKTPDFISAHDLEARRLQMQHDMNDLKTELTKSLEMPKSAHGLEALRLQMQHDMAYNMDKLKKELEKALVKSNFTQTPTELGAHVKEMAQVKDDFMPPIASIEVADYVWPAGRWKVLEDTKSRILEKDFQEMLKDIKQDKCPNEISFTGNAQQDGNSLQKMVDFTIHIKGKPTLVGYTTGILSLHSFCDPGKMGNADRKYNSKTHVGHAISRGITILQNAGPSRTKVIVGVTNLRLVQWFAIENTSPKIEDSRLYTFFRCPEIAEVRRSLVALLMAEPIALFVAADLNLTVDGRNVEIHSCLGSGSTSTVYLCEYDKELVAAKVYKLPHNASVESKYLRKLKDVAGVPTCVAVKDDNSLLLLSPIGNKITKRVPAEAKGNWSSIVDTLKAAHSKNIVHRDVRTGNIVLKDNSFLLIDWGFACEAGCKLPFHGSLFTASTFVFKQYVKDPFAVVFNPKDDLVSLVKALYLLSQPCFERRLCSVMFRSRDGETKETSGTSKESSGEPALVLQEWEKVLVEGSFWYETIQLAEQSNYVELKNKINAWGLDFCPLY